MPGTDLRGLPPWLLRAPYGERLGWGQRAQGEGLGGGWGGAWGLGGDLGTGSGDADGSGHRRVYGWTPRCSRPCCGGCSRVCTSTCSRWASGPCSTCPSGSCASSPAPCPSPRCCVSGTLSLVRVSVWLARWVGAGVGTGAGSLGCLVCRGDEGASSALPHRHCQSWPGVWVLGCAEGDSALWLWGNGPALGHGSPM